MGICPKVSSLQFSREVDVTQERKGKWYPRQGQLESNHLEGTHCILLMDRAERSLVQGERDVIGRGGW